MCFSQNLIETYNMSVVIYVSQLLDSFKKCLPSYIFSIQIRISGLEIRNFFNLSQLIGKECWGKKFLEGFWMGYENLKGNLDGL